MAKADDLWDEQHFEERAYADIEAGSCRTLFLAVLERAVLDAHGYTTGANGGDSRLSQHTAETFLTGRGRDMQVICELAGVDATRVSNMYERGELYPPEHANRRRKP